MDVLAATWVETNAGYQRFHVHHSLAWYRAHLRAGSRERIEPLGIREAGRWIGFLNLRYGRDSIAFTIADQPVVIHPVRMAALSYPGLPMPETDAHFRALIRGIFRLFPELDGLRLDALPIESGLYQYCERSRAAPINGLTFLPDLQTQVRSLMTFDERAPEYPKNFARHRKRLENIHGPVTLREFRRRADVETFARDARAIYEKSWHRDVLGPLDWWETDELLASMADEGLFQSFIVYAGDRPIAVDYGYRFNDVYYDRQTAYDRAFRSFSPGILSLYGIHERLVAEGGYRYIDLGYGAHDYKDRAASTSYRETFYYVYRDRPFLRAVLKINRAYTRFYSHIVGVLERTGLKGHLKAILKRKRPR
ncbi:GNAT family N-acetyltransferase [bacterium]|nr:GNAT family N-acetyltransferase [bacterium]